MLPRTTAVVSGQDTEGRQVLALSTWPTVGLSAPELRPPWAAALPGRPLSPAVQASPVEENSHRTKSWRWCSCSCDPVLRAAPRLVRWPLPAAHLWRQRVTLCGLSESLGWILIDRCGKHFGTILNYLRDDTIILPQNRQEIKELMAEAKYYLIQGLVSVCQTALQVWS